MQQNFFSKYQKFLKDTEMALTWTASYMTWYISKAELPTMYFFLYNWNLSELAIPGIVAIFIADVFFQWMTECGTKKMD